MQSWCIVNRGLGSVVEVLLRNLVPLSLVLVLLAWDIPWLRLAFLSCSSFDREGPPWAPYASCSLAGRGGIPVVRPLLEHPQMTSELLGKAGEPWPKSELIDLLSPKCGR